VAHAAPDADGLGYAFVTYERRAAAF
jgi:hypothetical protein